MWQFWCWEEYIDTGEMSTDVYIYILEMGLVDLYIYISSKANGYNYLMLSGSYFLITFYQW